MKAHDRRGAWIHEIMVTLLWPLLGGQALPAGLDPVVVGQCSITNVGGYARIAAAGNHAFVAGFPNSAKVGSLQVIRVTDPTSPQCVAAVDTDPGVSALAAAGNHVFVAGVFPSAEPPRWDAPYWFAVVDVREPLRPRQVGRCDSLSGIPKDLVVSGDYAYLAVGLHPPAGGGYIHLLDIRDPAQPRPAGQYRFQSTPYLVRVSGNYAYVASRYEDIGAGWSGYLTVVEVSRPTQPRQVYHNPNMLFVAALAVWGPYVYVSRAFIGGLYVEDFSDPAAPQGVGMIGCATAGDIQLAGRYAYLTAEGSLLAFDISDPRRIEEVGRNSDFTYRRAIAVAERTILLMADPDRFVVLELPRPVIKSVSRHDNNLTLTWEASREVRLQRAAGLTNPEWQDVPAASGTNTLTLPIGAGQEFFRLMSP